VLVLVEYVQVRPLLGSRLRGDISAFDKIVGKLTRSACRFIVHGTRMNTIRSSSV